MPYKKGDRIYWNSSGVELDPNYWTGTVLEDEIQGSSIIWRADGYTYSGPYVPRKGDYHVHQARMLFPLPAGMNLSTKESIFAKDQALKNTYLPHPKDRFSNTPVNVSVPPINDMVCKSCGNDRCSHTEKKCWLCGNLLQ